MNISIYPVLVGECRGYNNDSFEYIDKKSGQKQKLYKRSYIVECAFGSQVKSYTCDLTSSDPFGDSPVSRGDMCLCELEFFSSSYSGSKVSLRSISLLDQ